MKMLYIKVVTSLVMLMSAIAINAQDDHGHSHDEVGVQASTPGVFSVYAETKKYELTLKHAEIKPGQESEMTLYIADYATNEPLSDVDIKMVVQEDPSVVIEVEDGVQIFFQQDSHAPPVYLTGDYWLIAARVATGDVEWPQQTVEDPTDPTTPDTEPKPVPPHGVNHHFAPLAAVTLAAGGVIDGIVDLRHQFAPLGRCVTRPGQ